MTFNRELKSVSVISFTTGTDAYGQKRTLGSTSRTVEMYVKVYSQSNVSDIRYNEVTNIGLTKDASITDENQIVIDGVTYNVLYVIPSGRLHQILMKKVQ